MRTAAELPDADRAHADDALVRAAAGDGPVELWLLGLPPLTRFLDFVTDTAVGGEQVNRAALVSEWRTANDYYQSLEHTEAGLANQGTHRPLDAAFLPLADELAQHPHFRRTFDNLPTGFEMVELDRLIVYQQHVSLSFIEQQMARLGPDPDASAVWRFCLPLDTTAAPVKIQQLSSRRFVFRSPSLDLRFHEPTVLQGDLLGGFESFGALAGVIGLKVGFGSNVLNAIRVGDRMLLNNGYHRATALRSLGITHAPCIVQTATRVDELALTTKTRVVEHPEFYFESARPPMLADYFNPRLRKLLPTRQRERQIEISFEVKENLVCD